MNNLLNNLRRCRNKQDIKALIDYYIEAYVNESKQFNRKNFLGRDIGINPDRKVVSLDDIGINIFDANSRWVGYIPKDIKVVYGKRSKNGYLYNEGDYYYMGDESYLYEFAEWVFDKKVVGDISFILLVDEFLHSYFDKHINPVTRSEINRLLLDKNGDMIPPTREHQLSDLKGVGAGVCSEYSVMGQNIMTIFGLETEVICDERHAYNIYFEKDGEVNVLDFKERIRVYDLNHNFIKCLPFIEPIKEYNDDVYSEFLSGERKFIFPNYSVVVVGREYKIMMDDFERRYGVGGLSLRSLLKKKEPKLVLKKDNE